MFMMENQILIWVTCGKHRITVFHYAVDTKFEFLPKQYSNPVPFSKEK